MPGYTIYSQVWWSLPTIIHDSHRKNPCNPAELSLARWDSTLIILAGQHTGLRSSTYSTSPLSHGVNGQNLPHSILPCLHYYYEKQLSVMRCTPWGQTLPFGGRRPPWLILMMQWLINAVRANISSPHLSMISSIVKTIEHLLFNSSSITIFSPLGILETASSPNLLMMSRNCSHSGYHVHIHFPLLSVDESRRQNRFASVMYYNSGSGWLTRYSG